MASLPRAAVIREAGLRDGLQNIATIGPTAHESESILAGSTVLAADATLHSFEQRPTTPQRQAVISVAISRRLRS